MSFLSRAKSCKSFNISFLSRAKLQHTTFGIQIFSSLVSKNRLMYCVILAWLFTLMNSIWMMIFMGMFARFTVQAECFWVESGTFAVPKLADVFWSRWHELEGFTLAPVKLTGNRGVRNVCFVLLVLVQ